MKNSKRIGIPHFSKIDDETLFSLINEIKENNGRVSKEKFKISLKVDGGGIRFGIDSNKKFFFETSRSGVIYNEGTFLDFAIKNNRDIKRSQAYEDVFKTLKNHKPLQDLLKKYPGYKFFGELLYTPLGEEKNEKIKFVTVSYDKKVLGKHFSIVLYNIKDEKENKISNEKILKEIENISNSEIKFFLDILNYSPIDFSNEIDVFFNNGCLDIKSFEDFKKSFKNKILSHNFHHELISDENEGYIITLPSNKMYKIVTDLYLEKKFYNNK